MNDKQQQLSELLDLIGEVLDLTDTEYNNAVAKYGAVADHLKERGTLLAPYSPQLYAQGSFALGTMIRPLLEGEEYDLDMACELQIEETATTPEWVYGAVGTRLKESAIHRPKLEPKRRCWRINYAGEFHMDVVPSIPAMGYRGPYGTRIRATDREKGVQVGGWSWRSTDPKGYAKWFKERMRVILQERIVAFAERAKAKVEEVPEYKVKTPLQRAVQLLKRHRDVTLKHLACDDRPTSIILTTLAAKAYNNEAEVFQALVKLVREMPYHIENRGGVDWVPNPVNEEENFSDKWKNDPRKKAIFLDWLRAVNADLDELLRQEGLDAITKKLGSLFDERIAKRTLEKFGERQRLLRESGGLRMKTGVAAGILTAGLSGTPVRGHSFYGS